MLRKYARIFIPAAILYAVLILYLSITSKLGSFRHKLNLTLAHGITDVLLAFNLPYVRSFLVDLLNFVESLSIDVDHIGIYFIFGILLYFALLSSKNQILAKYPAVISVCIGTAYGVLNEIFQSYLPYRTASVGDAFSNMLGLVLAQLLVLTFILVLRQILKRTKNEKLTIN
jgi:VanZ family protein